MPTVTYMQASSVAAILERFYLDIVGTIIPGILFILLFWHEIFGFELSNLLPFKQTYFLPLLVVFAFVIGQIIACLYENYIELITKLKLKSESLLLTGNQVKEFSCALKHFGFSPSIYTDVKILRNLALSFAPQGNLLTYRFVAFSKFFGALIILVPLALAIYVHSLNSANLYLVALLISLVLCFYTSATDFYRKSQTVPFSLALAEFAKQKWIEPKFGQENKTTVVYLAGGFHSNWQDKVKAAFADFSINFRDPKENAFSEPAEYTPWDLNAIQESDVIFAFMEESNPGGYSLALEIGYARALRKPIIFIELTGSQIDEKYHYFQMMREVASYHEATLEDGIKRLKKLML